MWQRKGIDREDVLFVLRSLIDHVRTVLVRFHAVLEKIEKGGRWIVERTENSAEPEQPERRTWSLPQHENMEIRHRSYQDTISDV